MTRVLVATDGSELSVHAAQRAFELLGTADDVVVLAVLTEMPGSDAGGFEGPTESPAEEAQDWQAEVSEAQQAIAATLAEVHGARVEQRVEAGDAGPMIVWVAEQIGADLIVVGSHGRGVLKRMVVGSVSEHVVHHAPCPVLVVRRGADDTT
jgi:nucleotide-binding universal stress UspA family protein